MAIKIIMLANSSPVPNTYYHQTLLQRLQQAITLAHTRPMDNLRESFPIFFALLDRTRSLPFLLPQVIDLVIALHPFPKRWGYVDEWTSILHFTISACQKLNRERQVAELSADLANLMLSMGLFTEAIEMGRSTISHSQQKGYSQPLAWATLTVCQALTATGRSQEADSLLEEIKGQMPEASSAAEQHKADVLMSLIETKSLRRNGQPQQAFAIMEPIISRLQDKTYLDIYLQALVYANYAYLLLNLNRFQEMILYMQKAVSLYEEVGDHTQANIARGDLSYAYKALGQKKEAESLLLATINQLEKDQLQYELAEYTGYLAGLYMTCGELHRALPYLKRQISLCNQIGYESGEAIAHLNLSETLMFLGDFEAGLVELEKGMTYYQAQERLDVIQLCRLSLSYAYWGLGQMDEGKSLAESILADALTEFSGLPHLSLFARRCLALFCPDAEAIALLHIALEQARHREARLQEAGCLISLAGITTDSTERDLLWEAGVSLLREMGALAWIGDRSVHNPPFIGMHI